MNHYFNITFRGELTEDTDPQAVRQAFKIMFRASDTQLSRIFSGKVVKLLTDLTETRAQELQALLRSYGAITYITTPLMPEAQAPASPTRKTALELQALANKANNAFDRQK